MATYSGQTLRLPATPIRVQERNKVVWNASRSKENADFFTIGYERREPNELVDAMVSVAVKTVIDVRYTPVSMHRPDFSKSNLQRLLNAHGIGYLHRPDLGVPREIRGKAVGQTNLWGIWFWYDTEVVPRVVTGDLNDFLDGTSKPVAFLCMEYDPRACHRHRLALALERKGLKSYDL